MKSKSLLGIFFLSLCTQVFALRPDFDDLTLNGMATFEQLRQEYYIGALLLESVANDTASIYRQEGRKRMEIRVTADKWSPRRFAQFWNQAILINNDPSAQQQYADEILAFVNLPKEDLVAGDSITIDSDPDSGTVIGLNDNPIFSTKDPLFFDVLASTWIGMRPPSSEFKKKILNLGTDQYSTDLLLRYEALAPTDKRKKAVASWTQQPAAATPVVAASGGSGGFAPPSSSSRAVAKSDSDTPAKATAPKKDASPPSGTKPTFTIDKPVLAASDIQQPTTSAAKPATANPAIEGKTEAEKAKPQAKPAPKPVPPVAETKINTEELMSAYRSRMIRLAYLNVEYPKREVERGHEGTVILKVTLSHDGKVKNIEEVESSRWSRLNKAAREAVEKTAPFPKLHKDLTGDSFSFELPFVFRL